MNILGLLGAVALTSFTGLNNSLSVSTSTVDNVDTYNLNVSTLNDLFDFNFVTSSVHPSQSTHVSLLYVYNDNTTVVKKHTNCTDSYFMEGCLNDIFIDIVDDAGSSVNYVLVVRSRTSQSYTQSGSNYSINIAYLYQVSFQLVLCNSIYRNRVINSYCDLNPFETNTTTILGSNPFSFVYMPFDEHILLRNIGNYTYFLSSNVTCGNSFYFDAEEWNYISYVDSPNNYYVEFSPYTFGYLDFDTPPIINVSQGINSMDSTSFTFSFTSRPVVLDTNSNYQSGYDTGRADGYREGYGEGLEDGYGEGFDSGKSVGYQEGITENNPYTFGALFGAVADTPILIVRSLFNFDFFGVNVLPVVLSLFTAFILFYLIRKLF